MKLEEAIEILNIARGKEKGVHVYKETLNKAIETVLKELNTLQLLNESQKIKIAWCENNCISVDIIKDKIIELDKQERIELKGIKGQDRYFIKQIYQSKRNILEEILQEGSKN